MQKIIFAHVLSNLKKYFFSKLFASVTILDRSVWDIKTLKGLAKFQPILSLSFLEMRDFGKRSFAYVWIYNWWDLRWM